MKKLSIISVLLFSCALMASAFAADKIGYVDVGQLIDAYQKTKDFEKSLEAKIDAYDKEREAKINAIKQMQEGINILSEKEKEKKQGELENKIKEARDFTMTREGDIRKERDEKLKDIVEDIRKAVKQYSEQNAYTIILNSKILEYNNGANDITAEVAKILQAGYKK